MWRRLYSFFLIFALPFILLRLFFKKRSAPHYAQRVGERFALSLPITQPCIWIHTVSVGEFLAALPLVRALLQKEKIPILITTMTPTASHQVQAILGDLVHHCYAPYDFSWCINKFIRTVRPKILIVFETEIWPNWLYFCSKNNIPSVLVNARLSHKSYLKYKKLTGFSREIFSLFSYVLSNEQEDADRFVALGVNAQKITVTGNIKFDLQLSVNLNEKIVALRRRIGSRKVWIAASTHEGEENILLEAHRRLLHKIPDLLLILVPRHPERFHKVEQLIEKNNFIYSLKTKLKGDVTSDIQVLLGDTMGELLLLYGVSNVAFVAGSLIPRGGHNIIEPLTLKIPTIVGSYVFNFEAVVNQFLEVGAIIQVKEGDSLQKSVLDLLQDEKRVNYMMEHAQAILEKNKGALVRQLEVISEVLNGKKN